MAHLKSPIRALVFCLGLVLYAPLLLAADDHSAVFTHGVQLYEAGKFAAASKTFKHLSAAAPTNDEFAYWLGKAYGRRAEQVDWLTAIKYAKLTRSAFERAVQLNPKNVAALRDLAQYYTDAPGFLGGDAAKAAALRAQLKLLTAALPN